MGERFQCAQLYRKPGKITAHCRVQTERGSKWDFCKYQYLCKVSGRYEVTRETCRCSLNNGGNAKGVG